MRSENAGSQRSKSPEQRWVERPCAWAVVLFQNFAQACKPGCCAPAQFLCRLGLTLVRLRGLLFLPVAAEPIGVVSGQELGGLERFGPQGSEWPAREEPRDRRREGKWCEARGGGRVWAGPARWAP